MKGSSSKGGQLRGKTKDLVYLQKELFPDALANAMAKK